MANTRPLIRSLVLFLKELTRHNGSHAYLNMVAEAMSRVKG